MSYCLRYIILSCLITFVKMGSAQNLTGTWEGEMSQEFLQVNIVQEKNDEICGYTYDHFFLDRRNYCKAYFKGKYYKKQDYWEIDGISFLGNSGSHVLMRIRFWKAKLDGEMVLQATVSAKSMGNFIMSLGIREEVVLRRVAPTPAPLPSNMPPCFPDPDKPKEVSPVKPTPPQPVHIDTVVQKKAEPIKKQSDTIVSSKIDTIKKQITPLIVKAIPNTDSIQLQQKLTTRKNVTFSRIPVSVKNITLNVYDNAVVDGDTVSIFYNGKLLVNKQRLSVDPIVINLVLDEKVTRHEIILFAHNLGSIPPNTALIVVTAGDKRYELHSSASLEENAVLVFEYVPK